MGYKFEKYSIGGGGGSSGDYVLELAGTEGTLTDEQYNALVANAPNVVALHSDTLLYLPLFQSVDGVFIFASFNLSGGGTNLCEGGAIMCIVSPEKTYEVMVNTYFLPTQTYVDEAVAGAGGSGGTKSFMLTYSETETTDTRTTLKFTGVTNTIGNKYLNRLVTKLTAYGQTLAVQIQNTQAVVGTGYDAGTIMFNITAVGVCEPFYAMLKIGSSGAELVFEYDTLTEDMQTIIGTIQYSDYIRVDYEEV